MRTAKIPVESRAPTLMQPQLAAVANQPEDNRLAPRDNPEPWVIWSVSNSYVPAPIDVWDQNAIELYGLRMAPDITANEICDPSVGQNSAQLILQRGSISATITNSSCPSNIACLNRWTL